MGYRLWQACVVSFRRLKWGITSHDAHEGEIKGMGQLWSPRPTLARVTHAELETAYRTSNSRTMLVALVQSLSPRVTRARVAEIRAEEQRGSYRKRGSLRREDQRGRVFRRQHRF